ncbi:MAG: ArnT family glycosyltransferase [Planctomycetaceae bacterium]
MTVTSGQQEDLHGPKAGAVARRHRILIPLGLCIVGLITIFFALGNYRTLGSHEAYIAVPAAEMLSSGDYVVPRFAGLPRLEKPPLGYWVAAASVKLFGEMNEWTLRLPSALSAILLAALVWHWGRKWYGDAAGWGAAISQLTSVYVLIYARKAEVDMLLCLLTTAAVYLIANQKLLESRTTIFARWIGIYLLLALTWLAKFHYGISMVLAPACVYFLLRGEYRRLFHLLNPVGLGLLAAAVCIWPYLLLQHVPQAMSLWRAETLGRATGGLGHQPIWYFAVPLLWMLLPWTPYVLAAIAPSWRRAWRGDSPAGNPAVGQSLLGRIRCGDAREQFLWVWFLTNLAIVSLSADKHRHYIMSALPMFSLLAGQRIALLATWVEEGRRLIDRRWMWPMVVSSLVAGAVFIAIVVMGRIPLPTAPTLVVAATASVGMAGIAWLLNSRRNITAVYASMLLFVVCYVGVNGSILNQRDPRLTFGEFGSQIRTGEIPGNAEVVAYRLGYHSMLYYVDPPVTRVESLSEMNRRLADNKLLYVLTYDNWLPELATIGNYQPRTHLKFPAGFDALRSWPISVVELRSPQVLPENSGSPAPPPRRVASLPQRGSAAQ